MADTSDIQHAPKRKPIFLILGLVFLAVTIAAYVFEDALYGIAYNDHLFLTTLLLAVPAALFCTILYNSPRLAAELFGGEDIPLPKKKGISGGITYNVYAEEKPSGVAHRHAGWRAARRERRRFARTMKGKGRPGA
ncbi:MAG TPA: hypothetical protein VD713_03085 [Sphingomonadales bacterium]|nr:hypothetical protein [Sphingomonadales bacterium]